MDISHRVQPRGEQRGWGGIPWLLGAEYLRGELEFRDRVGFGCVVGGAACQRDVFDGGCGDERHGISWVRDMRRLQRLHSF
jgi:hypothetical protein